jgi:transcriptional regulator with XRE-family HTH domain
MLHFTVNCASWTLLCNPFGALSRISMACRRLKSLLKELILSIPELARAANLSEKTVRNLVSGEHKPSARTRREIVDAVNRALEKKKRPQVGSEIFD